MPIEVMELYNFPLTLAEEDVWACLGSRDKRTPALADEVAASVELARELCVPKANYATVPVESSARGRTNFRDGPSLAGGFVNHALQGAEAAVFVVVTVGSELEAEVASRFSNGDDVEAIVLDAAGSASVMNAFTHVAEIVLEETLERGWQTGLCLRPGQSYWDITGQRDVFSVVPTESIDVHLMESCFMLPQKTQSAIIPVGADLKVNSDPNKSYCKVCNAARCPMRQEEFDPVALAVE